MINIIWKGSPRFHVVFVIKRLLYIEFSVFRKEKKGLEMQERPKKRVLHVWVVTGDSWSRQSGGNSKTGYCRF